MKYIIVAQSGPVDIRTSSMRVKTLCKGSQGFYWANTTETEGRCVMFNSKATVLEFIDCYGLSDVKYVGVEDR